MFMRVLMVCLGNICRSPLAEGILKHKIKEMDLDWKVDSAGTGSWHIGEQPDPRSIAVARNHGLDIADQRGRQFSKKDFEDFDLIFTMDSENYKNVLAMAESVDQKNKVKMILNMLEPNSDKSVPDPYWNPTSPAGGGDGFEQVYRMLNSAIDAIIEKYQ